MPWLPFLGLSMLSLLPVLFALVACLYAMAGFGGGSTYIALLAISGAPLSAVPALALSCNMLVSAQGSWLLVRRGHAEWSLLAPLLAASVPCAFLGGAWRLPEPAFVGILAAALSLAGLTLLVQGSLKPPDASGLRQRGPASLAGLGAVLGALAGVTGIGGGIYLAPVLHLLRWGRPHAIAACASLFIAVNSLAGLAGQLTKGTAALQSLPVWLLLACPVAVLIGGRAGSLLLVGILPQAKVRLLTAIVVLLVASRLWVEALSG